MPKEDQEEWMVSQQARHRLTLDSNEKARQDLTEVCNLQLQLQSRTLCLGSMILDVDVICNFNMQLHVQCNRSSACECN